MGMKTQGSQGAYGIVGGDERIVNSDNINIAVKDTVSVSVAGIRKACGAASPAAAVRDSRVAEDLGTSYQL